MKLNQLIKIIPFIVSAALLYLLFKKIKILEFAISFHQINAQNFLIALVLNIPFLLLKSYKWHRIARMAIPDMRFSESIISFLVGLGASLFTPAQLGELARMVIFKGNRRKIFFLAFIDKLMDLAALSLLFAISMFFMRRDVGIILRSMGWLPFIGMPIWRNQEFKVHFLISQFSLSMICFGLLMLQFYVILLDFTNVRLLDVAVGLPIIAVAGMLPVTIGGLGLREMVASVVLPMFGMDGTQAVTASLLFFFVNGLLLGLTGIILGYIKVQGIRNHCK